MPYVLDDSELNQPAQDVLKKVKRERGSKLARKAGEAVAAVTPKPQSATKRRLGKMQKLPAK